jgi:hypothetical protein
MPHVSLIVEALRARPGAVFWVAALLQALLWVLVPALFYASPPGDLPETLAIGHEWQLGSWRGPPLAFWLAELAFRAAGSHIVGVYILAQACIVAACWAIFRLGRAIVGAQHAALAALLMAGILALSLPTPEFGPLVLAAPLTAFAFLQFWRALGQGRRNSWIALAFSLGLLLLTTYWGLLFFALLAVFLVLTPAGRAAFASIDPWAAAVVAFLIPFPHFVWLWQRGMGRALLPENLFAAGLAGRLAYWPLLLAGVVALHAGLIVLVVLAGGWRADGQIPAPTIEGRTPDALARRYVWFLALALPLAATLLASVLDTGGTADWATPFVLMSGLAVVVAAGPRITLRRQHVVGFAWVAVLAIPPVLLVGALVAAPWTGAWEWESEQPAGLMGRFYSDTFRRRVGKPLEIVVGDSRVASVVALTAPDRPRLYSAATPERTPWLTDDEVRAKGAIVLWEIEGQGSLPPPAIRARFPDIVAEVPQSFERPVQGFLPALRVGWAVIRPQPR